MPLYTHPLWGYELHYPESWIHAGLPQGEGFARRIEAFADGYQGEDAGNVIVAAEWNAAGRDVEPLWSRQIGMLASLTGARKVGAAPWNLRSASGLEAEILLPKQNPHRLWIGLLVYQRLVLKFMVMHLKADREVFEPLATRILSSLRFPSTVDGAGFTPHGLPLPSGYSAIDPTWIVQEIADTLLWSAYRGEAGVDALQAFYLREAPAHGWEVEEYTPFPAAGSPGFARLRLTKGERRLILGLMPKGEQQVTASSPGDVVIKQG